MVKYIDQSNITRSELVSVSTYYFSVQRGRIALLYMSHLLVGWKSLVVHHELFMTRLPGGLTECQHCTMLAPFGA